MAIVYVWCYVEKLLRIALSKNRSSALNWNR